MKTIHYPWRSLATEDTTSSWPTAAAEIPPMVSIEEKPSALLSIPLEVRLDIYDLCFFQDVCDRAYTRKDTWKIEDSNPEYFRELDLLIVNRQIYHEARDIAYAAQHHLMARTHQTYYVCQTGRRSRSKSPKWKWEIESIHWQPSCRSAKTLAKLRLPKLGLAICEPVGNRIDEQLSVLKRLLPFPGISSP